jgi:hypothetical protein
MMKTNKQYILVGMMLSFIVVAGLAGFVIAGELTDTVQEPTKTITPDLSPFIKEDFNTKYGAITFSSTKDGKMAEYSLISNTDKCLTNCSASGKATLYSSGALFDSFDAKDNSGKIVEIKDLKEYIDVEEVYQVEVPDKMKNVCDINPVDGKEICWDVPDTYKNESRTRVVKQEYRGEILPAGDYSWTITGKKDKDVSVDCAVGIRGISTDKIRETWTEWTTADCAGGTAGTAYIDGNSCVHVFAANSSITFSSVPVNLTVLVVAGGGGAGSVGSDASGGGGAGGLLYNTTYVLTAQNYTVTVGVGGAAGAAGANDGKPGTYSMFGVGSYNITTLGGGFGSKGGSAASGGAGGSGGGGRGAGGAGTAGPPRQGYDGGSTYGSGGGAGGVGGSNGAQNNATTSMGGAGLFYSINGTSVCYAGGGGGGGSPGNWTCGGGQGSYPLGATPGVGVNGKGGGGGGAWLGGTLAGKEGGSGIVIVRYNAGLPVYLNITGKVVDSTNTIVNNATIAILDSNGNLVATTTSNASGDWGYQFLNASIVNYTIVGYNKNNLSQGGNAYPFFNA